MTVIEYKDSDFKPKVLDSSMPVIVDFYAAWCNPCKRLMPHVETLAGELEGRAKVVKMDIDEAIETATSLGIKTVPTIIVFRDGRVLARGNDLHGYKELYNYVEPYI